MSNAAASHSFYNDNVKRVSDIRKTKKRFVRPNLNITAKTQKQKEYFSIISNYSQVIAIGCAGTGKTFVPTVAATKMLAENKISKIVLSRPSVSKSKSIGFFPGSLEEKMAPWVTPFTSTITSLMGTGFLDTAIKNGGIEIVPFEVMRGRSFSDAFIIIDEAQNCTIDELKMVVTRVGEESKLIINGDISQTDLHKTGLSELISIAEKANVDIPIINFTSEDIVRSGVCAEWVKAFESCSK